MPPAQSNSHIIRRHLLQVPQYRKSTLDWPKHQDREGQQPQRNRYGQCQNARYNWHLHCFLLLRWINAKPSHWRLYKTSSHCKSWRASLSPWDQNNGNFNSPSLRLQLTLPPPSRMHKNLSSNLILNILEVQYIKNHIKYNYKYSLLPFYWQSSIILYFLRDSSYEIIYLLIHFDQSFNSHLFIVRMIQPLRLGFLILVGGGYFFRVLSCCLGSYLWSFRYEWNVIF